MKNFKKNAVKIGSLLMAATLTTAALGACGGGSEDGAGENKADTLYVAVINKGYGTKWLEGLLDGFVAENEGWKYKITPVYEDAQIANSVEAGAGYCNYDLIFTGAVEPVASQYLADLKDVYESTYESGSRAGKTVEASMEANFKNAFTNRSKEEYNYKLMPWTSSVGGLLVNEDIMAEKLGADWKDTYKMRTTDELLTLCAAMKEKGLASFIHVAESDSHSGLAKIWWAQYNGAQGVKDYYKGYYIDGNGDKRSGPEVFKNEGTLKALEVMEDIFGGGYSHSLSNGIDWNESQSRFMLGESGMRGGGDWFMTEMGRQYPDVKLSFNKMPVISALGEKLSITEAQLIACIDYADGVGAKPTDVDDSVIEQVVEARSFVSSSGEYFTVGIPEYSTKLDTAKAFLKYMVSDKGQEIYIEKTEGLVMCYGYDLEKDYASYASLPDFTKSRWNVTKNASLIMRDMSSKLGDKGWGPFAVTSQQGPIEVLMSRSTNVWSAQKIYDYDYTYYEGIWNTLN